jgi:TRAP-type uncharacterized transport system fused permease subunit
VSEHGPSEDTAELDSAVPKITALATDVLQAALIICVVGWVIDLPRRFLGLSFYTEQLLAVSLGLALALTFVGGKPRRPTPFDWGGAVAAAAIVGYLVWRYNAPGDVPLLLYAGLALALAWTVVGGRAWTMRWFDWIGAVASLAICSYIAVRYEPLTYEIALLPTEGIIGSALLLFLVLEATRRT